jgi:hypothetical protein
MQNIQAKKWVCKIYNKFFLSIFSFVWVKILFHPKKKHIQFLGAKKKHTKNTFYYK